MLWKFKRKKHKLIKRYGPPANCWSIPGIVTGAMTARAIRWCPVVESHCRTCQKKPMKNITINLWVAGARLWWHSLAPSRTAEGRMRSSRLLPLMHPEGTLLEMNPYSQLNRRLAVQTKRWPHLIRHKKGKTSERPSEGHGKARTDLGNIQSTLLIWRPPQQATRNSCRTSQKQATHRKFCLVCCLDKCCD